MINDCGTWNNNGGGGNVSGGGRGGRADRAENTFDTGRGR